MDAPYGLIRSRAGLVSTQGQVAPMSCGWVVERPAVGRVYDVPLVVALPCWW